MTDMKKSIYLDYLKEIPVGINPSYGDAFQPSQWNNTVDKLKTLTRSGHTGPIMIGSKYIITDAQLAELKNIKPDIWLFIALTGLNETKLFTYEQYEDYYLRASSCLTNVVCAIRPIIPNQNDMIDSLLPIIRLVKEGRKMLTFGGYRDPNTPGSPKYRNEGLFTQIKERCEEYGILCKEKCACMVSAVNGTDCWIHGKSAPAHLDLIEALGYDLITKDKIVEVTGYKGNEQVTKGDLSFIKMVSKSPLISGKLSSFSEILSFKINMTPLVCTSSWFNWASQKYCEVNCNYCFANYKSKVRIDLDEFGCNPADLLTIIPE